MDISVIYQGDFCPVNEEHAIVATLLHTSLILRQSCVSGERLKEHVGTLTHAPRLTFEADVRVIYLLNSRVEAGGKCQRVDDEETPP